MLVVQVLADLVEREPAARSSTHLAMMARSPSSATLTLTCLPERRIEALLPAPAVLGPAAVLLAALLAGLESLRGCGR